MPPNIKIPIPIPPIYTIPPGDTFVPHPPYPTFFIDCSHIVPPLPEPSAAELRAQRMKEAVWREREKAGLVRVGSPVRVWGGSDDKGKGKEGEKEDGEVVGEQEVLVERGRCPRCTWIHTREFGRGRVKVGEMKKVEEGKRVDEGGKEADGKGEGGDGAVGGDVEDEWDMVDAGEGKGDSEWGEWEDIGKRQDPKKGWKGSEVAEGMGILKRRTAI
ncbi:hypothetical protein K402DRAFT_423527 [Aulographum hederae CBS 113979]|uniref:Uncharacterized protein n=1 Tax=Aulographum hederae CBS 113979 TaxID=1176131 RepID=A0A6G1GSD3_9PEZI|nr:hypothetical protein K402DRAFT_423527 [Aulographum hederae CBS 113979]